MSVDAEVLSCKSCYGSIIWAKTVSGKRIPIDATPVKNGNIGLEETADGVVAHILAFKAIEKATHELYVSHFTTCPQAEQHRRPR